MEQSHTESRRRRDDDDDDGRGGGGGGGGGGGHSRCALCVLCFLVLVLGVLLGVLLDRLLVQSTQPQPTAHSPEKDPLSTAQDSSPQRQNPKTNGQHVLYDPREVRARPLDRPSFFSSFSSLTGRPCEEDNCSVQYDDFITDILVTAGRRIIVSMYYTKALRVESCSGIGTVRLHCHPKALAELSDGLIAVTCYFDPVIVFVNVSATAASDTTATAAAAAAADDDDDDDAAAADDGGDGDPQLQQKIQTEKLYRHIAFNPEDSALLVSFRSVHITHITTEINSIDVLTKGGQFVRTLFSHATLKAVISLCMCHEHLIVTDSSGKILRIPLSSTVASTTDNAKQKPKGIGLDRVQKVLANTPNDNTEPFLKAVSYTVDAIFVMKPETVGVVWKKSGNGTSATHHYRRLLEADGGHVFETMAVFQDRLLVVSRAWGQGGGHLSRVTQYRLA